MNKQENDPRITGLSRRQFIERTGLILGGAALSSIFVLPECGCSPVRDGSINMAVEFVDHAAAAHIARKKGWFEAEGLDVNSFDNYMTGMSLANALSRGDVNTAYICIIPAITTYANGNVPIKVVAGTHTYGYGLLVDQDKVKTVQDLEREDIRIGCPSPGSPPDAFMHKVIDKYQLNADKILKKVKPMAPHRVLLSLKLGQLDAGFTCEQFPTMGEEIGFKELLRAEDVWPKMQGSVLVVTDDLLQQSPEKVEKMVEVTRRGIQYINDHPEDASIIVADALTIAEGDVLPVDIEDNATQLQITPEAVRKSLTTKMECTISIDPNIVQEEIDYLYELGYIKNSFPAEEILDLRFIN